MKKDINDKQGIKRLGDTITDYLLRNRRCFICGKPFQKGLSSFVDGNKVFHPSCWERYIRDTEKNIAL